MHAEKSKFSSAPMMSNVILANITKSFDRLPILENITFSLAPGQVTLLLGQNGAGKSTLLKILSKISVPDSGTVTLPDVRDTLIGYAAHDSSLYGQLSIAENLKFFGSLLRINPKRVAEDIETWGLDSLQNRRPLELSRGQLAKVGLARALLGDPLILVLDEPTAFLDSQSVATLIEIINNRSPSQFTVIATHDIDRIGSTAQRAICLTQNSTLLDSSASSIEDIYLHYRKNNR